LILSISTSSCFFDSDCLDFFMGAEPFHVGVVLQIVKRLLDRVAGGLVDLVPIRCRI
jgi:hypothetical protein